MIDFSSFFAVLTVVLVVMALVVFAFSDDDFNTPKAA